MFIPESPARPSAGRLLTLFILLVLVAAPQSAAPESATNVQDNERVYVPEYLLSETENFCLLKIDLTKPDFSARKKIFQQFVESAKPVTQTWSESYSLIGVDFADFNYFYLALDDNCDASGKNIEMALAFLGPKENFNWQKVAISPLLAEVGEVSPTIFGAAAFVHYRSQNDISKCLVHLQSPDQNDIEFATRWSKAIGAVLLGYRAPIIDIGGSNDELYVLFSRECSSKARLMANVLSLSSGDKKASLGIKIDLSPDANYYLHNIASGPAVVTLREHQ
jgi:hypothetical protein